MIQNQLFQILANLAMEPPARTDSESIRDEKVKVLKANPALDPKRGQFRGSCNEPGVRLDSKVETFAALRLEIESWRWRRVPFFIRAGKCLPVTATEIVVRLHHPPRIFPGLAAPGNYVRSRISPDVAIAMGATVMDAGDALIGQPVELLASRRPAASAMDAYERLFDDVIAGDATSFARQNYVEEAWRIVDPVLQAGGPCYDYAPGTWGPPEAEAKILDQERHRDQQGK